MSSKADSGKTYHLQCTGIAKATADAHSTPKDITLFGSCFCPFVQRVWAALEHLGIDYKYYEVDPYKKPADLLEVSPKGLVPGLRLENYSPPRAVNESTVILEFLEDNHNNAKLATSCDGAVYEYITSGCTQRLKTTPDARALIRLQADHVNRTLVPAFYRYIQAQDEEKQIQTGKDFVEAIHGLIKLFQRADKESGSNVGLWREGGTLSLADVMAGPWLFRSTNVLVHYRGFAVPEGPQFRAYLDRLLNYPAFKRTCSTEELYIDSYERYAHNRPNTSQVANAINSGTTLP